MIEFITSLDYSMLKVVGMILSGIFGLVMSWAAKRSVNYRKVDKRVLVSAFLFFLYLNGIPIITAFICSFVVLLLDLASMETVLIMVSAYVGTGLMTCALLWGVIFRRKRMKEMFARARSESKILFWQIHLASLIPIVLVFVSLPYLVLVGMQEVELTFDSTLIELGFIIWWFALMIAFVWRTSKYIFAEMKITMTDGEVFRYSCAPKMCRVHKNYIRLLSRDEKGKIIYERHINEGSIRQIEYFSEALLVSRPHQ